MSGPPTAVSPLIAMHVPVATLGVPTAMPIAALGTTLFNVTCTLPTCETVNGMTLVPKRFSVPGNTSMVVASTGVGAAGGVGSAQPPDNAATESAMTRIRFISWLPSLYGESRRSGMRELSRRSLNRDDVRAGGRGASRRRRRHAGAGQAHAVRSTGRVINNRQRARDAAGGAWRERDDDRAGRARSERRAAAVDFCEVSGHRDVRQIERVGADVGQRHDPRRRRRTHDLRAEADARREDGDPGR